MIKEQQIIKIIFLIIQLKLTNFILRKSNTIKRNKNIINIYY